MKWSVPPIWEGGDVWILGGGPSVTKQFGIPDDVVEKVRKGELPPSAYSPYMKDLHDRHVIGINVSYLIGNWIDMMFFGDAKFYIRNKESLAKWPGLKVSCSPSVENIRWIKYLMRDPSHSHGISKRRDAVSWNGNSGAAAISLAVHLGAKRIILLGFDMKDEAGQRHWHNLYKTTKPAIIPNTRMVPPKRINGKKIVKTPPFMKHLRGFPEIYRNAQSMGVEILNASPDSAITVFPKFSLKELLHDNS